MWIDRTKKHTLSLKLDDYELALLNDMAETKNISKSEALRNALWFIRIVLGDELKLKDIVKEQDWGKPLGDIIHPIPILANKIDLDLKLWNLIMRDEDNANDH